MGKAVRAIVGVGLAIVGVATGNFQLVFAGVALIAGAVLSPGAPKRAAASTQLQLGEQPRQAVFGRAAVGGSLVDAFNYGGKYGTDWEVLVIALADHRSDALEGFFVDDTYVAFTGDGMVPGFNNQLQVFFRNGTWDQTVPSILTTNGPGWTANDRGRGVTWVVAAYKADASDAKNPVYPSGRPRFRWVLRGLRCYQARKDSTVGGSGAHRWGNPATWEWTENPIDIRHNWQRGIYAGDRVNEPGMLLIGRGLSAIEAPPANVFPRANVCDELVGGAPRYRIGGVAASTEAFIEVETDFAAACAGVISQPQGAVEVDPGQAKAPVAHFTDADLIVGSKVIWNEGILGQQDEGWVNTVAARFVDPAQRWAVRSAPVRRDLADVVADGGPRESQPQLDLVTNQAQAQRIAEITRRFGRLWGRAQVTLPPRFSFIEEGDWVTWQSDRRFGGATLTFRVEAWNSDRAWHHQLTLRQISSSVFSDTAPLDDGSIASNQPAPPVVAAPAAGVWNAAAVLLGAGSVRVPNLRVAGTPDDPAADFVVFEYVPQVAAPDAATIWTFASSSRPDVRLLDIPVIEGGTYWVAVSYVVDGIQGARRVLGPISTSGLAFSDGSPVAPVAPANANRVPFSRMEGGRGWAAIFSTAASFTAFAPNGFGSTRTYILSDVTFGAAGQQFFSGQSPAFPVTPGERLSISCRLGVFPVSGPQPALWQLYVEYRDATSLIGSDEIASGVGNTPNPITAAALADFSTVPAGADRARLVLRVDAAGAGVMRVSFLEPMVTSAAAGQTVHPVFAPGPNARDGADPNSDITIDANGILSNIGTANINVDNRRAALQGLASARPASGQFIGQEYHSTDTSEISQWDGFNFRTSADITATAQRSIEPQFPSIEIKQGEAGHTGNRTITHTAKRGTATITGGTWSLPAQNLGTGSATINASTGTVTLSGIVQSGSYTIRYTHTDGFVTETTVNVTYVPTPPSAIVSAKTGRAATNAGTINNNLWQNILTLTMTGCPAGRVRFDGLERLSFLDPQSGAGTADFEARLQLDGVTLTSLLSQNVVTGGVIAAADFAPLFDGTFATSAGTRVFTIDLRRTSGTGTITSTNTALEATIIAS